MATVGRTRAQHLKEFYPKAKQEVSHGQRSSTLLPQHFKCTSCVSNTSRIKASKVYTRHSLGNTLVSDTADVSGADDYSGCTGNLKRIPCNHDQGTEQLNRLNEAVIVAVFHHHSKTEHNAPVRLASAPYSCFMVTDQTSDPLCIANSIQKCPEHIHHTNSTYLWEEEEECWLLAGD